MRCPYCEDQGYTVLTVGAGGTRYTLPSACDCVAADGRFGRWHTIESSFENKCGAGRRRIAVGDRILYAGPTYKVFHVECPSEAQGTLPLADIEQRDRNLQHLQDILDRLRAPA